MFWASVRETGWLCVLSCSAFQLELHSRSTSNSVDLPLGSLLILDMQVMHDSQKEMDILEH